MAEYERRRRKKKTVPSIYKCVHRTCILVAAFAIVFICAFCVLFVCFVCVAYISRDKTKNKLTQKGKSLASKYLQSITTISFFFLSF